MERGLGAAMAESGTVFLSAGLASGSLALSPSLPARGGLPEPDPLCLLVQRTSYGIDEEQWRHAQAIGYDAYLEEQLAADPEADRAREARLASQLPSLSMDARALIDYTAAEDRRFRAVSELRAATLLRRLSSGRQLHEVMVEFWSDHFSVLHTEGPIKVYKTVDDREIRRNALGRFGDLLRASARSPALLYYLDNYSSVAAGPNENYARELLEVHTVGEGAFSEEDVRAVARAFTGWGIGVTDAASRDIGFVFQPEAHDSGPKRVLGQDLPAGAGIEDGERVLDLLARHPATATRIATKLVRRFVSDRPQPSLVARVAATFRESDGDIRAMLRGLLGSPEFKASADQKLKRPAEYLLSSLRVLGVSVPPSAVAALVGILERLGHVPFLWPEPDGYPDTADAWTSAAGLMGRLDVALGLAEGTVDPVLGYDARALIGKARTAEQLVDRLAERLLRRPVAAFDRATMLEFAAKGGPSDEAMAPQVLVRRARELVALLLGSPYFQFR